MSRSQLVALAWCMLLAVSCSGSCSLLLAVADADVDVAASSPPLVATIVNTIRHKNPTGDCESTYDRGESTLRYCDQAGDFIYQIFFRDDNCTSPTKVTQTSTAHAARSGLDRQSGHPGHPGRKQWETCENLTAGPDHSLSEWPPADWLTGVRNRDTRTKKLTCEPADGTNIVHFETLAVPLGECVPRPPAWRREPPHTENTFQARYCAADGLTFGHMVFSDSECTTPVHARMMGTGCIEPSVKICPTISTAMPTLPPITRTNYEGEKCDPLADSIRPPTTDHFTDGLCLDGQRVQCVTDSAGIQSVVVTTYAYDRFGTVSDANIPGACNVVDETTTYPVDTCVPVSTTLLDEDRVQSAKYSCPPPSAVSRTAAPAPQRSLARTAVSTPQRALPTRAVGATIVTTTTSERPVGVCQKAYFGSPTHQEYCDHSGDFIYSVVFRDKDCTVPFQATQTSTARDAFSVGRDTCENPTASPVHPLGTWPPIGWRTDTYYRDAITSQLTCEPADGKKVLDSKSNAYPLGECLPRSWGDPRNPPQTEHIFEAQLCAKDGLTHGKVLFSDSNCTVLVHATTEPTGCFGSAVTACPMNSPAMPTLSAVTRENYQSAQCDPLKDVDARTTDHFTDGLCLDSQRVQCVMDTAGIQSVVVTTYAQVDTTPGGCNTIAKVDIHPVDTCVQPSWRGRYGYYAKNGAKYSCPPPSALTVSTWRGLEMAEATIVSIFGWARPIRSCQPLFIDRAVSTLRGDTWFKEYCDHSGDNVYHVIFRDSNCTTPIKATQTSRETCENPKASSEQPLGPWPPADWLTYVQNRDTRTDTDGWTCEPADGTNVVHFETEAFALGECVPRPAPPGWGPSRTENTFESLVCAADGLTYSTVVFSDSKCTVPVHATTQLTGCFGTAVKTCPSNSSVMPTIFTAVTRTNYHGDKCDPLADPAQPPTVDHFTEGLCLDGQRVQCVTDNAGVQSVVVTTYALVVDSPGVCNTVNKVHTYPVDTCVEARDGLSNSFSCPPAAPSPPSQLSSLLS